MNNVKPMKSNPFLRPKFIPASDNAEPMSQASKSSFSSLSSRNKLILANLQKDHSITSSCTSSSSSSSVSNKHNNLDECNAMNNSQNSCMTNSSDSASMEEDDVDIDDDILMTIMDLGHDVSSSLTSSITTTDSGMIFAPHPSRRKSYCNAAA
jgi:hypothetical protein